ncbi:MAG: LptF/LptG family permease [Fuerstiella sp.]
MFTTFDKYLLTRLIHTFVVFFVATYGLYMVIDLFTNVDDFLREGRSHGEVATSIGRYYGFRMAEFFEMAGPTLIVLSCIAVLGLLEKHSESHPILAAGIPAFRLLRPLLAGGIVLNLLLIANQELLMPSLAVELQTPRGGESASVQKVEPVYDYSNYLMHIDGAEVIIEERRLVNASFNLPRELAVKSYALVAESAVYMPASEKRPAGWLLQNLTGLFDRQLLTEEGQKRVRSAGNGKDVFIVSDVSFDQLYNRGRNLKLLSSWQLIERIRNPSTGFVPVQSQSLALHSRITRPLLSLFSIAMALPLVMRRESRSLIMNMAVCAAVLGGFYALTQASLALGGTHFLRPDLAAWLPVMVMGSASVWTAGYVQT